MSEVLGPIFQPYDGTGNKVCMHASDKMCPSTLFKSGTCNLLNGGVDGCVRCDWSIEIVYF